MGVGAQQFVEPVQIHMRYAQPSAQPGLRERSFDETT